MAGFAWYAKKCPFCEWVKRNLERENEELGQSVADSKGCGRSSVLTRSLVKDMGQVMSDRFLAQTQLPGDLGVGQPAYHKA